MTEVVIEASSSIDVDMAASGQMTDSRAKTSSLLKCSATFFASSSVSVRATKVSLKVGEDPEGRAASLQPG
jgi:hypothetical protein